MAAWRVTYTPGEWLVLSGPTMVVVMLPAPARMSGLVDTLWTDILAARSVAALLQVFGEYGLDAMSDFAAFFWDAAGLHGMARGELSVTDVDTGETVVSGSDVVTWREEALGTVRHLRVGVSQVNEDEHLQLPLVVGVALASVIHLSTEPDSRVRFPEAGHEGILTVGEVVTEPTAPGDAEVVGLGDETEMEPFSGSLADDDIPLWTPPDDEYTNASMPNPAPVPAAVSPPDPGRDEEPQVLAVPCARGHANSPSSRVCRICAAPVDSTQPQLIDRPVLAGVHSNRGEFVDVRDAVVVGRAPDATKGPRGARVMRVPSPSSDISRSHLMVEAQDWDIVVTDLGSTNGTTILPTGEQSFELESDASVRVGLGTVLDLGDGVSLRIEPPRG